jgi:hypothetical protein
MKNLKYFIPIVSWFIIMNGDKPKNSALAVLAVIYNFIMLASSGALLSNYIL